MHLFFFLFNSFRKFKSKQKIFTFNYYISFFLISFSIISLILTESFTLGYKNELIDKYKAFSLEYSVLSKYDSFINSKSMKNFNEGINSLPKEILYYPYIQSNGILYLNHFSKQNKYSQREGIYIKGIKNNLFNNKRFNNDYLLYSNRNLDKNSIVLGEYLSKNINKGINDTISLMVKTNSNKINFKKFIISNIYKTGIKSDEFLVFVHFDSLKELIYRDDSLYVCDGIFLDTNDLIKESLINEVFTDSEFKIESWDSLNYNLLKFLNFFDIPIKTISWILMFLSIYSLSAFISNMILERRNDFKILYFIGLTSNYLKFLIYTICLYISITATLFGTFISLVIIFLQKYFNLISLPSEKIFQMNILPVSVDLYLLLKYPLFIIIILILMIPLIIIKIFKSLKIINN